MSDDISLSDEQQEIAKAVLKGYSTFVNAVPGAGKTTTSLYIAQLLKDKELLLLTFSSDLKTDARKKKSSLRLSNIDVHSYNSLPREFYDRGAKQDEDIFNILRRKQAPIKGAEKNYDVIILDETQDMTHLHYKFIMKFIEDFKLNPVFLIIGDDKQAVFKFKGADSRFLTLSPCLFESGGSPLRELKLTTSFRLTNQMSQFMNEVILGEQRINTIKEGRRVLYMVDNTFLWAFYDRIFKMIRQFIHKGYTYEDIFILAPSVTSPNSPINKLNAHLANQRIDGRKILIYHPTGDDGGLNEDHMRGKITMTTYHRAKGRERKLVIVLGCDESYYSAYGRASEEESRDVCPEPLYVALTRGTYKLVIVHQASNKILPFFKMPLSELSRKSYCDFKDFTGRKNIDAVGTRKKSDKRDEEREMPVTRLTRYLSQAIELQLIPIMNSLFRLVTSENGKIPIRNDIINGHTKESVADLNGIAIPAIYEFTKTGKITLFRKYEAEISRQGMENKHRSKLILKALKNIENPCSKKEEFLRLANIGKTLELGIESNLNQIEQYDWLDDHCIERTHNRLDELFGEDVQLDFEVGAEHSFTHDNGKIKIRGAFDVMTKDTIYELKCTDSLDITHKIQVVLYAWLYIHGNFDPRKFILFNMKTNESYELNMEMTDEIHEIVSILVNSKLMTREITTDEEFLEQCKSPVQYADISDLPDDKSDLSDNSYGSEDTLMNDYLISDD